MKIVVLDKLYTASLAAMCAITDFFDIQVKQ